MKQVKILLAVVIIAAVAVLAGVFGFRKPAVAPSVTPTPSPAATPAPTSTPAPAATPEPTPTAQEQGKEVTLGDNNLTVTLKVGETFLLNLGESYDWDVAVDDQSVVSRVVNILVIRGAQGVYKANAAGRVVLRATGNPTCLKSIPPCGMPSILFKVDVAVE